MILVIFGRKGCGKTTQIKTRVQDRSRVLIFDSMVEFGDVAIPAPDRDRFLALVQQYQGSYFRIAYQPMHEDMNEAFSYFMRAVWATEDCVAVVDEVDAISTPLSVPDPLRRCINYGRHQRIDLICAARRAAEVPRSLTAQADEIVSFNQSEPIDQQYLKRYVSQTFADAARNLPRYRFVSFVPWGQPGEFRSFSSIEIPAPMGDNGSADRPDGAENGSVGADPGAGVPTP